MKIALSLLVPLLTLSCQPKSTPETTGTSAAETEEVPNSGEVPVPSSFVGLTLEEAEAKAEKADLPHRVIKRDGEELPVTRDYRPERLNFSVQDGKITEVTNG